MGFDLAFLSAAIPTLERRRRQSINFFRLLGLADREDVADRVLSYFFDPTEAHGFGTSLIDALLLELKGGHLMGATGALGPEFDPSGFLESTTWTVSRQVQVVARPDPLSDLSWSGFADIYLTNEELSIAVIVENKIWAAVHNPLESYVGHALDGEFETVLLAVLAPYRHALTPAQAPWVSKSVTYEDLLTHVSARDADSEGLDSEDTQELRRSRDLLQQFIEVRQKGEESMDYTAEASFMDELRGVLSEHHQGFEKFLATVKQANRVIRDRSKRLEPLIRERLIARGWTTTWEAHGGRNTGTYAYMWNAYQLQPSMNSVELIMSIDPQYDALITVKAYPGRSYRYYAEFLHIPLGVGWETSDDEIADAFMIKVEAVLEAYPSPEA